MLAQGAVGQGYMALRTCSAFASGYAPLLLGRSFFRDLNTMTI